MAQTLYYEHMLQTTLNLLKCGVVVVNDSGDIIFYSLPKVTRIRHLQNKKMIRVLRVLFGEQAANEIYSVFEQSLISQQPMDIIKFSYVSLGGAKTFLRWHFSPVPNSCETIICVQNVTETVLIEEEFCSFIDEHESVNRDLCAAISNLDFYLMDIEQAHKKLSALYRITSVIQRTVDLQEVLAEIINGIVRELGYINAAILLLDENSNELMIKAHIGYENVADDLRVPLGKGITGTAALQRELVYCADVREDLRYIRATKHGLSEVAIPLIVNEKVIGVLDVETPEGKTMQSYDLDLLRSLASHIAMTISHAAHVAEVQFQAITDGLTGLYNYRYFRTLLQQEFKRALRYNRALAMLMIDIDHFKQYNDTCGHRRGDDVIRTVAFLIRQSCRDVDFIIRYGGEEFAVLLPETSVADAYVVAERIRTKISEYPFFNSHTQPNGILTVSIGVAGCPDHTVNDEELVEFADKALYFAKRTKRNLVTIYNK